MKDANKIGFLFPKTAFFLITMVSLVSYGVVEFFGDLLMTLGEGRPTGAQGPSYPYPIPQPEQMNPQIVHLLEDFLVFG